MITKRYKYQQVKQTILEQIASGALKKNDRIPSERELAKMWGMSALTVSKALAQMEKEGYLVRKVGDGTYVRTTIIDEERIAPTPAEKTRFIFMLINDLSFGLIPHVTHLIEEQFTRRGYHIILKSLRHSFEGGVQILNSLNEEDVCGFIFNPIHSLLYEYENTELCRLMERYGRPIVMIDSYLSNYPCPNVTTDNYAGGYEATRHLLERGHSRIGLLWQARVTASTDRMRGYAQAIEDAHAPFSEQYIHRCQYLDALNSDVNPCAEQLDRLFQMPKPPTAIFALDDYLAHYTLRYCQEKGLAVPEDVAIVGYDDFLPSSITTVRQDVESLAEQTLKLFTDLLHGNEPSQRHVFVPPKLIVRKSS